MAKDRIFTTFPELAANITSEEKIKRFLRA
jgi:hypothetical protein